MALYLQMDGVDDYLKLPSMTVNKIVADVKVRRRTDAIRILWDFRSGIGFSYLQQNASGIDVLGRGTAKVNGVSVSNNSAFIPNDIRCIIEHDLGIVGTDDGNIFSSNGGGALISGDIFDIKLYNGTTLVAHYDMTTGTVQDQSGNGNHATLTGGTWLDDGIGGDTGTDDSTAFDLKQVIYSDASITADTKQSIYADSSVQHDIRNVIYQDGSTSHDLRQSLYEILSTVFDTKQVIYDDSATAFDMLQEIFNDGQIGSTHFDMRIQLYVDDSTIFDSKQSWYEDMSFQADLKQAIYEVGQSNQDMRLVIYADSSTKADTLQQIYSDSYTVFDTKQTMFNPDTQLIGTIQLKGSRKLYVYLKGSRIIDIKLKGRVGMTEINQNFSMYSGESKILKVPITSDVPLESGVTAKWALKKKNYSTTVDISKSTNDGISIENGEVHIKLVPEDTATLAGSYYHECELTDNAGNVSTVFEGLATIKKSGV